jgi:DNA repair protein RadA/Sms
MAKVKSKYVCQNCGYFSVKWLGKCPECGSWESMVEEIETSDVASDSRTLRATNKVEKPVAINAVALEKEDRFSSGIEELDVVLGGGIVKGSLMLVGGDPGIGKSTMLLQVADNVARQGKKVLYVSGEESVKQTKMRADRLDIKAEQLYVLSENNMDVILGEINQLKPDVMVIDSIQTVYREDVASAPGSVSQVREATGLLMKIAKGMGISTFIVGHVTKNGAIAGPKVLEHMVDTVLYFEGERYHIYRILRAVKNRFGSTNEIGVYEMTNKGLRGVSNPSNLFISERRSESSGSVVTAAVEGTRPVLVEIQALVSQTTFGMPRRTAVGVDYNKLVMLMAVLEKKVGLALADQDCYINVVGGMSMDEPSADLAVVTAVAASFRNFIIDSETLVFGEVGLTGEIRNVSQPQSRINEGVKLGFKRFVIPYGNVEGLEVPPKATVLGVKTVEEAFSNLFGR